MKQGSTTRYINRFYEIRKISFTTTCFYQYCGDDSYYITCAMFALLLFSFPVMHHSLHHLCVWSFNRFTILPIFEGGIICLSNFILKNPFVIAPWVKMLALNNLKYNDMVRTETKACVEFYKKHFFFLSSFKLFYLYIIF